MNYLNNPGELAALQRIMMAFVPEDKRTKFMMVWLELPSEAEVVETDGHEHRLD